MKRSVSALSSEPNPSAPVMPFSEVVRLWVERGSDLNVRETGDPGFCDKTALDLAASIEQSELVELIRERLGK